MFKLCFIRRLVQFCLNGLKGLSGFYVNFVSAEDWGEPARLSSLCSSRLPLVSRVDCLPPRLLHFSKVSTLTIQNKSADCCFVSIFAFQYHVYFVLVSIIQCTPPPLENGFLCQIFWCQYIIIANLAIFWWKLVENLFVKVDRLKVRFHNFPMVHWFWINKSGGGWKAHSDWNTHVLEERAQTKPTTKVPECELKRQICKQTNL